MLLVINKTSTTVTKPVSCNSGQDRLTPANRAFLQYLHECFTIMLPVESRAYFDDSLTEYEFCTHAPFTSIPMTRLLNNRTGSHILVRVTCT